ncbi:thiamine transporter 1-like isoform X1 [Anopheles stephensi]|uniref:Reduced folate carrier n=1 Tax=Anopheles stephensi TaxID=30069 RepID=A0A182YLF5_ANOST|nr:thiamine transporter 1-like isoform X1 [Anopheles stephensi]
MQPWLQVSLLLCVFGFFRELRVSEPFVTEFLSGEWRDIEPEQLNRDVYPIGTYSQVALLVFMFLLTDVLRYKSIIVFSACLGIVIWSLLLWTESLAALQVVQVLYGAYMASEVAYYTYIYAKISREKYQQVTGNTRAAILLGRFLSGVISQILVSTGAMNVRDLNYITLGTQAVSLLWSFLLPSVKTSVYFYSRDEDSKATNGTVVCDPTYQQQQQQPSGNALQHSGENALDGSNKSSTNESQDNSPADPSKTIETGNTKEEPVTTQPKARFSASRAVRLLWKHFISAYRQLPVVQWSLWWALAMAGFIQVQVYVQLLWHEIDQDQGTLFNGGAEALLTLLGAISALAAGYIANRIFEQWALWILTVCSGLQGGLIFYSGFATNIWVAYVLYILFGTLYLFMVTMASAIVAKYLEEDSFGLIFGINTFVAIGVQALLTLATISERGLMLDPRDQFKVYGGYFLVLSIIYLIAAIVASVARLWTPQTEATTTVPESSPAQSTDPRCASTTVSGRME